MGLLAKLLGALGWRKASPTDGRAFERYLIGGKDLVDVMLAGGAVGAVLDVSYAGIALSFPGAAGPAAPGAPLACTLRVLDRSVAAKIRPVRTMRRTAQHTDVSFTFVHDTADALMVVRELLEPLRCGHSLTALGAGLRDARYAGPEWACFRGDGPTDLIIRGTDEATMTFRRGSEACELTLKRGAVRTGASTTRADEEGAPLYASTLGDAAAVDRSILSHAVFVVAGMPVEHRALAAPVLDALLKALAA